MEWTCFFLGIWIGSIITERIEACRWKLKFCETVFKVEQVLAQLPPEDFQKIDELFAAELRKMDDAEKKKKKKK